MLKKSTLPLVVALVTNIRYVRFVNGVFHAHMFMFVCDRFKFAFHHQKAEDV